MICKINKALDLNKLFFEQTQGKLLKKKLVFPVLGSIKYDGNYVVVLVENGNQTFITSGGLTYTHTDGGGDCFKWAEPGAYIAERISRNGILGDRNSCNLRGPKSAQTSTGHTYMVHDYLTLEEYAKGFSIHSYCDRMDTCSENIPIGNLVTSQVLNNMSEVDSYFDAVTSMGFEGIMLKYYTWKWEDTKSRNITMCKYKKRPTADLICIGVTPGEGKYTGLIGSLILKDSKGRIVSVGSGLSDDDRSASETKFLGNVVEIEYEQIVDTYIQPTYIRIRLDKTIQGID